MFWVEVYYVHGTYFSLLPCYCNISFFTWMQLDLQDLPTSPLEFPNWDTTHAKRPQNLINLLNSTYYMTVWRNKADLSLAPWHWTLWAFCTSSSSLCFSSCSWSSVSGEWCCWLSRLISWSRDSFSRSSCRQSQSRSASARSDQLSLSNWANWCWIPDILRERGNKGSILKSVLSRYMREQINSKTWWNDEKTCMCSHKLYIDFYD